MYLWNWNSVLKKWCPLLVKVKGAKKSRNFKLLEIPYILYWETILFNTLIGCSMDNIHRIFQTKPNQNWMQYGYKCQTKPNWWVLKHTFDLKSIDKINRIGNFLHYDLQINAIVSLLDKASICDKGCYNWQGPPSNKETTHHCHVWKQIANTYKIGNTPMHIYNKSIPTYITH